MLSRNRLWLTKTEAEDLGKELTEVIERYRHGRTAASHPPGTRQVTTLAAVVPVGKPPEDD
jgi:hypothetical protein